MNPSADRVIALGFATAVASLLVVGPHAGSLAAQARERELYVSVLTPSGAPATDLTASEFLVREDGISREVLRVVPATEPLQLALLVDNSAAAEDDVPDIRDGLKAFVEALTIDRELAVITIADRPTILCDYTTNRSQIDKCILGIFPRTGSGSYAMEAIIEVARGLQKREAARPVMVVISTEGPELSDQHERRVLDTLAASGASLNVFLLASADGSPLSENGRVRSTAFDQGSRASGGRRDLVLTSQALPDRLRTLAAELSHQYRVTYARPDSLIPPRSVTVGVTRAGHAARGNPVRTPKRGA